MYSGAKSGAKVTSEIETLKTKEFLRRRKLRLQQVREQSKDIAKQIRHRANVEKHRHIVHLDTQKEKEYVERQEKIVRQLEDLYAKSVQNVGASHKSASDLNKANEESYPAKDLSKIRGREAAALLQQEKQKKLDEQKKSLDRKLQAREVANELFREKSKSVPAQLQRKPTSTQTSDEGNKKVVGSKEPAAPDKKELEPNSEQTNTKIDMGTQWNFDELPSEWEPSVPKLSLQDKDSLEAIGQSEQNKQMDLFALSEDMPLSLRGGPNKAINLGTEKVLTKPSLTMVSEYLQQRNLRLREPDIPPKKLEDLQSIKETIHRTRAVRTEGNDVCSVHDQELIPVPLWKASSCQHHSHASLNYSPRTLQDGQEFHRKFPSLSNGVDRLTRPEKYCSNSFLNHSSRPLQSKYSSSTNRSTRIGHEEMRGASFRTTISPWKAPQKATTDKNKMTGVSDLGLNKKPSVTVYNHSTRDTRDIIHKDQSMVIRETPEEDAYSQAIKKNSETVLDKEHDRKLQDMRSKIAMTKKSVEKEYNETISFLNSLPKEKPRIVKQAFMDDSRQQMMQEKRQRKIQQEYQNIERDCRRSSGHEPGSPVLIEQDSREQYSWMPVPEGEAALGVHSVPVKPAGRGRQVQFGQVDSYHEYRTRHKHTPPTKDKPVNKSPKTPNSSYVETLVADVSITSSDSEAEVSKNKRINEDTSDAERIIIYKIVDSRKKKRSKANTVIADQGDRSMKEKAKSKESGSPADQLKEDIYKNVDERGDHIPPIEVTEPKTNESEIGKACACGRPQAATQQGPAVQWECGDVAPQKAVQQQEACQCQKPPAAPAAPVSASASTCSFRTAPAPQEPKDAGNFYIGASGFLKDEDYEVIIQLRKKDVREKGVETKGLVEVTKAEQASSVIVTESQASGVKETERIEQSNDQVVPPPVATQVDRTQLVDAVIETQTLEEKSNKLGISAFTQTTLSSPLGRPALFHMSSSTSTAYMSPPDALVPKTLEAEIKNYRSKHCKCKKCKDASKVIDNSNENEITGSKRTSRCSHHKKEKPNYNKTKKHKEASGPPKQKDCKCRKCVAKAKCSKKIRTSKRSNQKAFFQLVNRTRNDKGALNPTLKGYINKLLACNTEGLKAMEISNQECSSVATPGSSVVDVDHNVSDRKLMHKISMEQIKALIKKQVADNLQYEMNEQKNVNKNYNKRMHHIRKTKTVHKVKTLNISKNIHKSHARKTSWSRDDTTDVKEEVQKDKDKGVVKERKSSKSRSQSSPTPQPHRGSEAKTSSCDTSSACSHNVAGSKTANRHAHSNKKNYHKQISDENAPTLKSILSYLTSKSKTKKLASASTRMEDSIDDDINLMKITKSKYRNMEKIADLTKKCSQRISDLAEKLDEVRKSKSSGFSQICSSSSSSEGHKSDKSVSDIRSDSDDRSARKDSLHLGNTHSDHCLVLPQIIKHDLIKESDFVPLLEGIKKPESSMTISPIESEGSVENMNLSSDLIIKLKNKPPPALSRINLKLGQENIPHELSTVIEVDSPISLKTRSQRNSNEKSIAAEHSTRSSELKESISSPRKQAMSTEQKIKTDTLKSNTKPSTSKASSKPSMMDLQQFNDIILKPYISVEEYAKQRKVSNIDKISAAEETLKISLANDEMSSLHSDGSLPDVVAELLKRKVISEPFKFDSSTGNSTNASSESSLSVFSASNIKHEKKNSVFQNKENKADSSDTFSFSSNPDLENAFKQMGIGWASSTLKKTKERQALTSSSNTSSGSQNHKPRYSEKSNTSGLSDSILKLMVNSSIRTRKVPVASQTVDQRTSQSISMTVKDFLAKELANRITFSKASEHESQEFVSLCETKMPEEMKNGSIRQERSLDDSNNNRARTSTPVQLYKSATYKSSSSSNNMSNGLFSNLDDLSSVKVTSSSMRNHSTSDKDDLTIPNYSLRLRRNHSSASKSE